MAALLILANTLHPVAGTPATVRITLPPALPEPQALMPIAPDAARMANAEVPIDSAALAPAAPFRFTGSDEGLARAVDCLAAAAWYEAGDDPRGERAVVQTVLNRARHPAFPATVCGVVFQGSERPTGCQFTFTCDGALARTPSIAAWARARAIGAAALNGQVDASVGTATHYHADYVVPYWQSSLVKIAQVGAHLFYRWPGTWGLPAAFSQHGRNEEPAIAALARLSPAHASQGALASAALPALTDAPLANAGQAIEQLSAHYPSDTSGANAAPNAPALSGDAFLMALDPDAFPGSYATRALGLCAGHGRCMVLGWRDPALHASALPLTAGARSGLSFVYVRDASSGSEGTYWNCTQIPRSNPEQCLPQGSALDRLLARVQPSRALADAGN